MRKIKNILNNYQLFGLLLALSLTIIIFSLIDVSYISFTNLLDILNQSIINGLLAIGITVVIIGGGIDLSIGSIFALAIVFGGKLLVSNISSPIAIILTIIFGLILGIINGLLVTKMGLQPFIATLGTMSAYRGVAYLFTGGWPVLNIPTSFRNALEGNIVGGVTTSLLMLFLFACIGDILLKKTRFGTYVYAMGSNEEATRLSGINVSFHKIWTYGFCGIGASLSGLILLARLGTGEPTAGQGYELTAIAASAVGGTSLAGGEGRIAGTVLGAVLLSALRNGLIVVGVDTFWQYIATGVVIIIAVYLDYIKSKSFK